MSFKDLTDLPEQMTVVLFSSGDGVSDTCNFLSSLSEPISRTNAEKFCLKEGFAALLRPPSYFIRKEPALSFFLMVKL